jgi:hypothetical protein
MLLEARRSCSVVDILAVLDGSGPIRDSAILWPQSTSVFSFGLNKIWDDIVPGVRRGLLGLPN